MYYNDRVEKLQEYEKVVKKQYLSAKRKLAQSQRLISREKFNHVLKITKNNPLVELRIGDGKTSAVIQGTMGFSEAIDKVNSHMNTKAVDPNHYKHNNDYHRRYFDNAQCNTFWLAMVTPIPLEEYPIVFFEKSPNEQQS